MNMNMMNKFVMAIVAIGMIVMGGLAEDGVVDGSDVAIPTCTVYFENGNMVVANVGTSAIDVGGATIHVNDNVVGKLPYTTVLGPNPFTFTVSDDAPLNYHWKATVPYEGVLVPGDVITVTNGVGTYAKAVVK